MPRQRIQVGKIPGDLSCWGLRMVNQSENPGKITLPGILPTCMSCRGVKIFSQSQSGPSSRNAAEILRANSELVTICSGAFATCVIKSCRKLKRSVNTLALLAIKFNSILLEATFFIRAQRKSSMFYYILI